MVLDLLFLICLALALFIGFQVGFLRALVGFMGMIVSAIGGYLLYPYVTPFLMNTPLYDVVNRGVLSWLSAYLQKAEAQSRLEQLFFRYQANTLEALLSKMADGVTVVIMNVISVLLIIVLVKLAVILLKKVTRTVNEIPLMGTLNRLCGMALTAASFVTVCFLVTAVMLLPPSNTSELTGKMCEEIDRSYVVKELMDYNFFVDYEGLSQGL